MDEVTPVMREKPMLCEYALFYLGCFNDLSSMRTNGFNGVERLKVVEMQAYCEMFDIDEREQFFYNMRAADDLYMEWVAKAKK